MISLQTALKYFDENKDKDVVDEQSAEASEKVVDKNVLEIVKTGDRCPKCGKSNIHNVSATVVDVAGETQRYILLKNSRSSLRLLLGILR